MSESNGSLKVSVNLVMNIVQIATVIVTVTAWGWSIKTEVALQAAQQQALKEKIEMLERKTELLRYDISQQQLALAAKGIITIRETP